VADALDWPIEYIPDNDSVFMRAHETYFRDGELEPGVFTPKEGPGMSVDWDKYSSKEQTRQRARKPEKNAVISMLVGGIRKIDQLDVAHRPEPDNRAHSEVDLPTNEELTEIRFKLNRLAQTVIPLANL
jgi:hypothetical protein